MALITQASDSNGTMGSGVNNQRAIFAHTDGTWIAINKSDDTTNDKVKIYSSPDKVTWTLQATHVAPFAIDKVAGALFTNGDVAVVYRSANKKTLRYIGVTKATWTISGAADIFTLAGTDEFGNFDVDASDTRLVAVAFQYWVPDGGRLTSRIYCRGVTTGTWLSTASYNEYVGESRKEAGESVSIACANKNIDNEIDVVYVVGAMSTITDYGVMVRTLQVHEADGNNVSVSFARPTKFASSIALDTTRTKERHVKVFRVDGTSLILGFMNHKTLAVMTATIEGVSWTEGVYETYLLGSNYQGISQRCGITVHPSDVAGAYSLSFVQGNVFSDKPLISHDAFINPALASGRVKWYAESVKLSSDSGEVFAGGSSSPVQAISDGPNRNFSLLKQDFLYQLWYTPSAYTYNYSLSVIDVSEVVSFTPTDGAEQLSSTPKMEVVIDRNLKWDDAWHGFDGQFATDAAFTTSVRLSSDNALVRVDGTDASGVTYKKSRTLSASQSLTTGIWYYRVRLIDNFGNASAWSATRSVTVGTPPSAIPKSPIGGGLYNWNNATVNFVWSFYDLAEGDYQSAYQVIFTDETGFVIHDSGKVASANKSHELTGLDPARKDALLSWKVRVWDSEDTASLYSDLNWFTLTDPPAVTVQNPDPGEVFDTGVPTFLFTPTTGGTRTIVEYTISVLQGANTVWSVRTAVNVASGTQLSHKIPTGYLKNNQDYSLQFVIKDSGGMSTASSPVAFSTAWIPPDPAAGVTVNVTQYNVEDEGYIQVGWDDTARDPDFVSWMIYRKVDLVDPNTGSVVEAGSYELIYEDFSTGAAYIYKDFFAPSNYQVTYSVRQIVNRLGQEIESLDSNLNPVIPLSDGYWFIHPSTDDADADAFKFSIVTADSFTDDQEEAEFIVIGRGRVVNKGQKLGVTGQLDVQLRSTGGTTARQKRLRLKELKEETRQVYLRNPFGDIFKVSTSGMSISRISGVGGNEYCDVTLTYTEVS